MTEPIVLFTILRTDPRLAHRALSRPLPAPRRILHDSRRLLEMNSRAALAANRKRLTSMRLPCLACLWLSRSPSACGPGLMSAVRMSQSFAMTK